MIPIKYLQKKKKKIDPFNREPRDLLENFCPTLFHKLFPTDNTTLDLWNVEIDGTSHNCSKCFHPTVTRATLIRRFRSRSRRGSRRLDVWTLLVVQLSASDRPTGIRVDRWARRGFHETVCRRLVKKKKSCYSNEVSVGVSFSFFFFLSRAWNDGQDERNACAHSLQLSVEKYDGWENGNDGEISCARMGARKKEGMRIYNEWAWVREKGKRCNTVNPNLSGFCVCLTIRERIRYNKWIYI